MHECTDASAGCLQHNFLCAICICTTHAHRLIYMPKTCAYLNSPQRYMHDVYHAHTYANTHTHDDPHARTHTYEADRTQDNFTEFAPQII